VITGGIGIHLLLVRRDSPVRPYDD
jgi:hypothetical protein